MKRFITGIAVFVLSPLILAAALVGFVLGVGVAAKRITTEQLMSRAKGSLEA